MKINGNENSVSSLIQKQTVYRGRDEKGGAGSFADMLKSAKESEQELQVPERTGRTTTVSVRRGEPEVPYSILAKDGIIEYNGVNFVCNSSQNAICLGDVSDKRKTLNIPMAEGGLLKVNVDNLEELMGALDMFSPEDMNAILRAVALYKKTQEIQDQLDAGVNIGEKAEEKKPEEEKSHAVF